MTLSRRRFLTIAAAFAATPARAGAPLRWQGRALGAEVSLELSGPRAETQPALEEALKRIRRVEALFNLHDPTSALSRLNRDGVLREPPDDMLRLFEHAGRAHALTGGRFDPTVQPVWRALAEGRDLRVPREAIGWDRVRFDAGGIRLAPGQALTFNGIAQGYATDLVTDTLMRRGMRDLFVDIGEQAARGRNRRVGLVDPAASYLGWISLRDGAVATSSPGAMQLGTGGHILGPRGEAAMWSTVSVVAPSATLADGLSTGLSLGDVSLMQAAARDAAVSRILAVDAAGNLSTFGGT